MKSETEKAYQNVVLVCKNIFEQKNKDYKSAWRILRPASLTDQIFIKAQRIRTLEEKGKQCVDDAIDGEFIGIINYCVMAIMQLQRKNDKQLDIPYPALSKDYDQIIAATFSLMKKKNHDYGEIWRSMRISSMVDIILMKILRIKQIEDNQGKTMISEGIVAGFRDIINYAIFSLILLEEKKTKIR